VSEFFGWAAALVLLAAPFLSMAKGTHSWEVAE
jgi:hypothetical protein